MEDGPATDARYYLGAWRRGQPPAWTVSELWFNPDSIGTGWWTSRGYLTGLQGIESRNARLETVPVEAWALMPVYEGECRRGEFLDLENPR